MCLKSTNISDFKWTITTTTIATPAVIIQVHIVPVMPMPQALTVPIQSRQAATPPAHAQAPDTRPTWKVSRQTSNNKPLFILILPITPYYRGIPFRFIGIS